jgi:hypothetical protein
MNQDRVLIRLSDDLELFLAGVAVVHNFMVQQNRQMMEGMKSHEGFRVTVELGHEEQFFFSPLFPHLDIVLRGQRKLFRQDWECIIDMLDSGRVMNLAKAQQKHITETWGILCGATPQKTADLGAMAAKFGQPTTDVLIDANLNGSDRLEDFFLRNFPTLNFTVKDFKAMRACHVFDAVADTKLLVGRRSAATYLAAMMKGKKLVEYYPPDFPLWFLDKNVGKDYRVFWGDNVLIETLWLGCCELLEDSIGLLPSRVSA